MLLKRGIHCLTVFGVVGRQIPSEGSKKKSLPVLGWYTGPSSEVDFLGDAKFAYLNMYRAGISITYGRQITLYGRFRVVNDVGNDGVVCIGHVQRAVFNSKDSAARQIVTPR